MGTRPAASTRFAIANCWSTTALMPSAFAAQIRDRALVPRNPSSAAIASVASRLPTGFMSMTPSAAASRPASIFMSGTTFLVSHRYVAAGAPPKSRAAVSAKRIAARTRSPPKDGDVTILSRMAWTSSRQLASS